MSLLEKNTKISSRKIENELFLYDRTASLIHSFNATGTFLWEHFSAACATPQELAALLAESYEVDLLTAEKDADEFLKDCLEKKLLVPHA